MKVGDSLDRIRASVWSKTAEDSCDAQIVISIDSGKGKNKYWVSSNFNNYLWKNQWGQVFFNYQLPKDKAKDDLLKIYIWNYKLKKVYLDDFRIRLYSNR